MPAGVAVLGSDPHWTLITHSFALSSAFSLPSTPLCPFTHISVRLPSSPFIALMAFSSIHDPARVAPEARFCMYVYVLYILLMHTLGLFLSFVRSQRAVLSVGPWFVDTWFIEIFRQI